ncbi:MAG: GTPase Era [Alphaproteobacteria bacterium RIFCSPLOWO2_01_FULL_40_26]|nr:MAG: GTPase Era [Alphaproteobacteria bacterium RIFCSPHIGHO2_02_FULL_40_34]OFW93884.1 MAG: GTPase Era [Alphaproteobacteria bacterium RIFCSPLOWO2_01_FULL_40_26]OFX09157.1 MAG: GTPase Era [Alphaproteobacteria bacterium RIFCSPLOWO2_02_FULL_40_19]OFX11102.1 MAG: GTPase Era [Alphaproteobacteria bacterium RIFCSPLOWO2_12_FULL_40_11]
MKKHGIIAIVGAPNAGKSTLTNALLGQKLTIVSPKVQTTRNSIRAIAIEGKTQLILIDTPGIFIPRDDKILERIIVKSAWQALRGANHICFVIDATSGVNNENSRIISDLKKENLPLTIVINKIDLVKKSSILEIIASLAALGFEDIIPISAGTKEGVENLKKFLSAKCTNNGWIYDENQITDAPMRFIASEITREKLFLKLHQELPYSLAVKTDSYEVLKNGGIKIHQTIFVLKESQKQIIIGKKGAMIKNVGEEARKDLAMIAGAKVHLFLFVKVKKDWMNDTEHDFNN